VTNANVSIFHADARQLPQEKLFDRVLVDAPCSGTGTLARNPEIKWRIQPRDLADLQQRQVEILLGAAEHVSPGGRIVYATCSLEPQEGENVVERVIDQRRDLAGIDIRAEMERLHEAGDLVWNDVGSVARGTYLRTVPGVHPCDGFFAVVLNKK
jgi:16S rRNA (cytosine967-C5)-methyltransferase